MHQEKPVVQIRWIEPSLYEGEGGRAGGILNGRQVWVQLASAQHTEELMQLLDRHGPFDAAVERSEIHEEDFWMRYNPQDHKHPHDSPRPVPGLHHKRRRPPEDLHDGDRVRWEDSDLVPNYGTVVHLTEDEVEIKLDVGGRLVTVPRTELKLDGTLRRVV